MARGMVVGEAIVSQAQTKAFDEGYERTFGARKPQRGRWVWDAAQGKLVSAEDYVPPAAKTGTGIMVDRFMEGERAPDVVRSLSRSPESIPLTSNCSTPRSGDNWISPSITGWSF